MEIRPIKTEQDYELALKQMETVFHAKPNTTEGDLLEILSMLIHEYEQKNYKIEPLTPLEAVRYEMEEQGLNQNSLAQRFGMSKSTVSEILNGKKQMSVRFMKYLHQDLGIPANVLLA
jgi:HTH-type transcriptional regulator/antitoxin HigA